MLPLPLPKVAWVADGNEDGYTVPWNNTWRQFLMFTSIVIISSRVLIGLSEYALSYFDFHNFSLPILLQVYFYFNELNFIMLNFHVIINYLLV